MAAAVRLSDIHSPRLDGLRGLAILLVMMCHQTVATRTSVIDRYLFSATELGWCGVDLFFVLSGFLITGILLDNRESPRFFSSFYGRRALRILPLYYLFVFLGLVLIPQIPHPKAANFGRITGDEWYYWTFLTNFAVAKAGIWRHAMLDVTWSVAIEEQFYLAWPLVVFLLPNRWVYILSALLVAVAFCLRVALVPICSPLSIYVLTPTRMDALALGAMVAVAIREPSYAAKFFAFMRVLGPLAGAVIIVLWLTGCDQTTVPMMTVGFSCFGLFFCNLLCQAIRSPAGTALERFLTSPLLVMFGKYSYCLYLVHLPIRAVIRDLVYGPSQFPFVWGSAIIGQLAFFVLSTLATLPVAIASWYLFESRFLGLKSYFPR